MELQVKQNGIICELIVKSETAKIVEDVADSAGHNKFEVDQKLIENIFTAGIDLMRYNKKSDVETIKMLFDAFLNDSERIEFLQQINAL